MMQPTVIRFTSDERAAIDKARGSIPLGVWVRKACAQALAPDGMLEDLRSPDGRDGDSAARSMLASLNPNVSPVLESDDSHGVGVVYDYEDAQA